MSGRALLLLLLAGRRSWGHHPDILRDNDVVVVVDASFIIFTLNCRAPLTVDLCHLEAVFFSLVWEIELFLIVLRSDRTQ